MADDIDRLVLRLEANTKQFENQMRKAQGEANKRLRAIEQRAQGFGKRIQASMDVTIFARSAASAASSVLGVAGGFEQSMNRVRALSNATADEFTALRDQALKMGRETAFSASQAADAMGFLAMAGFNAEQAVAALPGTLSLASAAQLDLADTADIVSNVLTGFSRPVEDLADVNDVLVAAFTSSNTNLQMMGQSFKFVGPVAAAAGVSFNETAAAIGLLGNAGLQAEMAGTGLRGAITKILSPAASAKRRMEELGIEMTDASGDIKPLAEVLEELAPHADNAGLFMELFGQRAGPAMITLVNQGSDALRSFTERLDNSAGVAQRIAETQMMGLNGALRELNSAWEDLLITAADEGGLALTEAAVDRLRDALRYLSENFQEIVPWIERLAMVIGARLTAGALIIGMRAIVSFGLALKAMAVAAYGAAAGTRALTFSLSALAGPATVLLSLIGLRWLELTRGTRDAAGAVDRLKGSLNDARTALNDVEQADRDLIAAKEAMRQASENYTAALNKEGPAAREAARQEVEAINKRINSLEALREVRMRDARSALFEANQAKEVVQSARVNEILRQNAAAINDFEEAQIYRDMGEGHLVTDVPTEAPSRITRDQVEAQAEAEIDDIRYRMVADPDSVSPEEHKRERNSNAAAAAEIQLKLLEEQYEKVEAYTPPEGPSFEARSRAQSIPPAIRRVSAVEALSDELREAIALSDDAHARLERLNQIASDNEVDLNVGPQNEFERMMAAEEIAERIQRAQEAIEPPENATEDEIEALKEEAAALENIKIESERVAEAIQAKLAADQQAADSAAQASKQTAEQAAREAQRRKEQAEQERQARDEQTAAAQAAFDAERAGIAQATADEERKQAALREGEEVYERALRQIQAQEEVERLVNAAREAGVVISEQTQKELEAEIIAREEAAAATRAQGEAASKATQEEQAGLERVKALRERILDLQAAPDVSGPGADALAAVAGASSIEDLEALAEAQKDAERAEQRAADIAQVRADLRQQLAVATGEELDLLNQQINIQQNQLRIEHAREDAAIALAKAAKDRREELAREQKIAEALADLAERRDGAQAAAVPALEARAGLTGADSLADLEALIEAREAAVRELDRADAIDAAVESLGEFAATDDIARATAMAVAIADVEDEADKAERAFARAEAALKSLFDARGAADGARFEASLIGLEDEGEIIRLRAEQAARERARALGIEDDDVLPTGQTGAAFRGDLEAEETRRMRWERAAEQRRAAIEIIDGQRTAEEKLADETQRLSGLEQQLTAILVQREGLTWADAEAKAIGMINLEIQKVTPEYQKLAEAAKEFGQAAGSALEDVVFGAKDAGDAVKGLALELSKIVFRQFVAKPFENAIGGAFDNLSGSLFGGLFGGGGVGGAVKVKAATGGYIAGPGGPRDDAIPAMLSNGEYVVNATATAQHRRLLDSINSGVRLPAFASGGYVGGSGGGSAAAGAARAVNVRQTITVTGLGVDDVERKLQPRFEQLRRQTVADVDRAYRDDYGYLAG